MKKRLLHIIIIFCLVTILLMDVVSAFGLSVFMTPSTTNVQASSELTIKVKVSNLDVGENGINTFSATLYYDKDVFEELVSDNVSGLNNWTASYAPDTGKVTLFKTTFVNSDEELFQVSLKTKSAVTKNSGIVSLKNIIVGNGDDEISSSEVSTSISIGSGITITPSNNNTATNSIVNTSTNNLISNRVNNTSISITNKINNVSNYNNTNTSISNKLNNSIYKNNNTINNNESITNESVPYTGTRENVRIALIVLLVVAGYIYIKFEKLNKVC